MANCNVSKETMKRLISDIKDILKNPLTAHGIYYKHDETDMLKGKALIIGPKNTPYEDGFYFFKFEFPVNYPHAPPKVIYCTNDGIMRFNPNLYRCGKVCLSILNTWQGEPWSACQTITSILLVLCTVLNDKPLLNEPGVTIQHRDYNNYNKILKYKNIEVGILNMLENTTIQEEFTAFTEIMQTHFKINATSIQQKIEEEINLNTANAAAAAGAAAVAGAAVAGAAVATDNLVVTAVYQLRCNINYKALYSKFKEINEKYS